MKALERKSTKGMAWSSDTVKKALQLRFSCGLTGYEVILNQGLPYPSSRTLRRRVQAVKFTSGILDSVLEFMQVKVMDPMYCLLVFV